MKALAVLLVILAGISIPDLSSAQEIMYSSYEKYDARTGDFSVVGKTGFFGPTRDYFASVVSDNKKRIAIYAPIAKGEELTLNGALLDDDVNTLHHFNVSHKADNDISYGEALLGNDGAFYLPLLARVG